MNDFPSRLRQLRRAQKLSQKKLALLAGVSQPYIAELERGVKNPSVEVLQKLCDALGCSADYLLGISAAQNVMHVREETALPGSLTMEMLQRIAERHITPDELDRAIKVVGIMREEKDRR
jgi:transcriptional regulator with XRE-family HTH domain